MDMTISLIAGGTVHVEKCKLEALRYRPTAGRSLQRTEGFIFLHRQGFI